MASSTPPVFYDPRERRWRWAVRSGTAVALALAILSTLFVLSLAATPLLPSVGVFHASAPRSSWMVPHPRTRRAALASATRQQLLHQIARETRPVHRAPGRKGADVVCGFFVNWEDSSLTSLARNVDRLTHLAPDWLVLQSDGFGIDATQSLPDRQPVVRDVTDLCRRYGIPIIPLIKNFERDWDATRLHRLLSQPSRHREFAAKLRDLVVQRGWQGINIDFEAVPRADRDHLTHLMGEIHAVFHAEGLLVTQDVQAVDLTAPENHAFDCARLAQVNDFIVYMAYDEHEESHEAGPIASLPWLDRQWRYITARVPADRLVLAIGNYAYDWPRGRAPATNATYQAALIRAADHNPDKRPQDVVRLDPVSLNPTCEYTDDQGVDHVMWLLNAPTAFNAWALARRTDPRGVALWYLGAEDPSIWSFLDHEKLRAPMDYRPLEDVQLLDEVDYEGAGEILSVVARPRTGKRKLSCDAQSGMITGMAYSNFPSPYVLKRTGKQARMIALTFDDGPDPTYTPAILAALRSRNVAGTFFVVGQNVERYPGILRDTWEAGHEIGNHTFTHPNMSLISPTWARLEVNATQRAIESVTGHCTLEFRPPYNVDAEPRTAEEIRPLMAVEDSASSPGHGSTYYTVGNSIDPHDWDDTVVSREGVERPRTAEDVASFTVESAMRRDGNIVLLHDAGGDRQRTVQALPVLIDALRARGFTFVTVSELLGKARRGLNPPMDTSEDYATRVEGLFFGFVFGAQRLLYEIFLVAIGIGLLRVLVELALVWVERRRERAREATLADGAGQSLPVSVVIAAYNEARVITRTVETVLGSTGCDLVEVIVVDDGSSDDTAGVVQERFGGDERVRLIRQENGGKASALNHGIAEARGSIIVSLDADTLFTPDTIAYLVARFDDSSVGGVAGNVKVGNRVNALTQFQSIEYVTSQNLDRRAYAVLNAITVVPGAIGAWRREAIEQAGGYTSDTLAEDTDLTWRVRRCGWTLATESRALAFTEAPETASAFFRQRFRWSFGTLQCLWKHRGALGRHGWFGRAALPFLWVYQMIFQPLSPLIDLQVLVAVAGVAWARFSPSQAEISWVQLAERDLGHIAFIYAVFFIVELIGAIVAYRLDREKLGALWWLFLQRIIYRQLMYAVTFKTLLYALRGRLVGWGKLERTNTARAEP